MAHEAGASLALAFQPALFEKTPRSDVEAAVLEASFPADFVREARRGYRELRARALEVSTVWGTAAFPGTWHRRCARRWVIRRPDPSSV